MFGDEKEEQPEELKDLVKEDILETEPEAEENTSDSLFKDLMDEVNDKGEEVEETEPQKETYLPNQIKSSEMIMSMNFGLSRLKSISVMKRVADMLGIDTRKKEPEPVVKEEPKQVETNDLFWTPTEYAEMKSSTEEAQQEVKLPLNDLFKDNISKEEVKQESSTNNVPEMKKEDNIFEKEQLSNVFENNNNIFENNTNNNIFETNNGDGNIIFPEPVMPTIEEKKLPVDNDSDKFKWPDNSNLEKFDLNGIFPN